MKFQLFEKATTPDAITNELCVREVVPFRVFISFYIFHVHNLGQVVIHTLE